MYDMYPEWGPAAHDPQNPESQENIKTALQRVFDRRDHSGQRPDDN